MPYLRRATAFAFVRLLPAVFCKVSQIVSHRDTLTQSICVFIEVPHLRKKQRQRRLGKGTDEAAIMCPVITYIHYYLELMESMDKGKLTEKKMEEIFKESRRLRQLLDQLNKEDDE